MGAWVCHMACFPIPRMRPQSFTVVMVGPGDAGKTSVLNKLSQPDGIESPLPVVPTVGFNMERIKCGPSPDRDGDKELHMCVWDLGAVVRPEQLWRSYLPVCDIVVFVVDSDACRRPEGVQQATDVLQHFLTAMKVTDREDVPIYVMANKQDKGTDVPTAAQVSYALRLRTVLEGKRWAIGGTSAEDGSGLSDAIDWIVATLK